MMTEIGTSEIAEAACVSADTVRRWARGTAQPGLEAIESMASGLDRSDYVRLHNAVLAMIAPPPDDDPDHLDVNGDGRVDLDDQRYTAGEIGQKASDIVTMMLTARDRGDLAEMQAHAQHMRDLLNTWIAQGVVEQQTRRSARPLRMAGGDA